jgi:hypothetical protein
MGKFIFNGPEKKIYLDPTYIVDGVLSFSCLELWSSWVNWQVDNPQYLFALSIIYEPLYTGGFIGPYLFLRNDLGWVGVPLSVSGASIQITGGAFYGMNWATWTGEGISGKGCTILVDEYSLVMEDGMSDLIIEDGGFDLTVEDSEFCI